MKKVFLSFVLPALILSSCSREGGGLGAAAEGISREEIGGIIEYIAGDHLEGRAPGTRGAELAEEYVKSLLRVYGIEPYGEGYFQEFTLEGFTLGSLETRLAGSPLEFGNDIVGNYTGAAGPFDFEGEAVFAGFGIVSEDWDWDDYKDYPVAGKVVIVRVNEPGRDDPELFEGGAMTYYGRWTYKIEEAAKRGAAGILLVHTDDTAGYGWHVVENSWGGEELYLAESLDNAMRFRGWIREERLREILEEKGIALDRLYDASNGREFGPVELGITFSAAGSCSTREFKTRNVVGHIKGSDPVLSRKAILLSAHTDHLGMNPELEGDRIFNGAIDNGSAVAAMMVTAKKLREHGSDLRYSVIVLACEAEESGLLGSMYFAGSIDPEDIICNINFESTPVWEAPADVMAIGARFSTLEDILVSILEEERLGYSYFSMYNSGFFYRSDQFSFARRGIPSLWISAGDEYPDGEEKLRDFFTGPYHTVDDEYDPGWDLGAAVLTVRAAILLCARINERTPEIGWKGKMTFPVER